jgi:hypothetical protein
LLQSVLHNAALSSTRPDLAGNNARKIPIHLAHWDLMFMGLKTLIFAVQRMHDTRKNSVQCLNMLSDPQMLYDNHPLAAFQS